MNGILKNSFWLAPLVSFVEFVSYFLFFAKIPVLRDFPWINLPLVLIGFILSFWGIKRFWKLSSAGRRFLYSFGLVFSTGIAALFVFYVFWYSYKMPTAGIAKSLADAPSFSLTSSDGTKINSSDYRGKKVLLSFFRGYW